MTFDNRLQEIFKRHALTAPAQKPSYCPYAEQFSQLVDALCNNATQSPSVVSLNQAKVVLLDKWRDWCASAPKKHRAYTGKEHTCIFHVFEAAYERLRAAELALTPPMLFVPEPTQPRQAPQIAGIFIGEMEEE